MYINKKRRLQMLLQSSIFTILFLALVALLAILSRDYSRQWDVTQNARNSISGASIHVLGQLKGPVAVTAYAAHQDPRLGDIRKIIRDFIAPYQRIKPDLSLRFVDPVSHPQDTKTAGVQTNGELVVEYDGRKEHLTTLNEQAFTNLLMRLARGKERLIMYLDGHGERKLDGAANFDLGDFGKQLRDKGFRISPLNLTIAPDVPSNASLLVLTAPQVDLLPGEVDKLKHYLASGGDLLWLIDQAPLHGLQPLAEMLGLSLTPGTVVDPAAQQLRLPPTWALASQYGQHPITRNFNLITVFPFARQIGFNEDRGWQATPLIEVAPNGWVATGNLDGPISFDKSRDVAGPVTIGIALQRPVKNKDQRVVVVGSGAFLANSYLGNGGNLDLGINMVNWLTGDENLISIQPHPTVDQGLQLTKTAGAAISLGFLVALPLLLLGSGVALWLRRRKR